MNRSDFTLTELQQAVLMKRLRQRSEALARPAEPAQMTPVDRSRPLPLSFAQQRLWFLSQLEESGSTTYHIPSALRLSGTLDRPALRRSLDQLLARHEALRTVFDSQGGQPQARLLPATTAFSLQEQTLEGGAAQLAQWMDEEAHAPFELGQGPLIRARLIQESPSEHLLLITQHHIVSDGWSRGVFLRELGALYTAFTAGDEDPLPALAIQYPDFAAWQRSWLSGERLQAQVSYWREQLAEAPVLLELPTDRPRPAQPSYAGASVAVAIDATLTAGLKQLAQRHGSTLYMVMLAAWSVVLSRLSGQSEVVIGTPTANRSREELESLIGFFVNTLALRVDLGGEPSGGALLERVRAVALAAQDHQELPFEQVVEIVQPPRRLSHSPLFQVMLAWQNNEEASLQLPGVQLSTAPNPQDHDTAKFDLTLALYEQDGVIKGALNYATALFDAATIERQRGYLLAVLQAMAADDAQAVDRIELLSAAEREQLLEGRNQTAAAYPTERCVHELFEAQVQRTPDAVALVQGEQSLSYAELNRRANVLAHRLLAMGVQADARVAICAERRPWLVEGLLGILKAGGAYVPLDPGYPTERLQELLSDAQPMVVLADAAGQAALGEALAGQRVLSLDEARSESVPAAWSLDPVRDAQERGSDRLAYVIYTSGSTGKPKGAQNEHRAAVNRLVWMQQAYALRADDVVLQKTPYSFDVSVWEFFWTLLYGATLVLAEPEAHKDPHALVQLIRQRRVTTLHFVPSMLSSFLEQAAVEQCDTLRRVVCSGEALPASSVHKLRQRLPQAQLYNLYGPTEAAIDVTAWTCPPDFSGEIVPIGRPIANTRIYLLDAYGQPVPQGAVGELYIGGVGVARGYLNRPALTAERFLRDPFVAGADARMYRTGDLARYRPDGEIEFLGRNDHQVKLRGFRIELGEIEARLSSHPQIREAVVLSHGTGGEQRLVAYVTARPGAMPEIGELRSYLSRSLPEYMLPAAFVMLEQLPLTANGKLDRKALPAPELQEVLRAGYVEPRTENEQILAQIWALVLKQSRVGIQDDFFELGGHSLLATQVISRLREAFALDLPLRWMFETRTIAAFADRLFEAQQRKTGVFLPPLQAAPRDTRLPLSYGQERLWLVEQLESVGSAYHASIAIRLTGPLDAAVLERSLAELVRRHESLRTHFELVDGQPCQVIERAGDFTLQQVSMDEVARDADEGVLEAFVRQEAQRPFELSRGPLFRASLLPVGEQEHGLLLGMHHVVSDAWSNEVLMRELASLYESYRDGAPVRLAEPVLQYADYALWQRSWLQGDVLERQLAYWKAQLAGAPPALELPTDHARPAVPSYRGAIHPLTVPAELSAELGQLARQEGVTLFMLLLAAYQVVLSRWSGQDQVVVGTPAAGRTHRQTEGLVGFFVNTLALRGWVSEAASFRELLAQVKETALAAYAHQELPFEKLVQALAPVRDQSRQPIFQAWFALQRMAQEQFGLPGLQLEGIARKHVTAKFDLTLVLEESDAGLRGKLEYAADLFEASSMARLAEHLVQVLAQVVAQPGVSLSDLTLTTAAERHLLLETWNATAAAYPRERCLHELFAARAAQAPEAIAASDGTGTLSYGELERRSNQLAHYLRQRGVGPEVVVGLCVPRSLSMLVGMLGILKAGGAYLPIDPSLPAERMAFMLDDARAAILLTESAIEERLPSHAGLLVFLDLDTAAIERCGSDAPTTNVVPANAAYVIYTSGSTGQPKGVLVPHRGAVNLAEAHRQLFQIGATDRVLQFARLSFDASVSEVMSALHAGAQLCLADVEDAAGTLARVLVEQAVTVATLPPSVLGLLEDVALPQLHTLVVAGESCQAERARQFSTGRRFINAYGPTEASVCATAAPYRGGEGSVPIGRPIANVQVYVLDARLRLAPIGVVGELYIAGEGLARGYLKRPSLTAQRFIANPYGAAGSRLYRTGDLVRYRADGELEFLGRVDHQVKLRGYRIELGEIEVALGGYPGVKQAVVIDRVDGDGTKRLVAYLVGDGIEAEELRGWLGAQLPEYMLPSAYVTLEQIPLTANGKLDRHALPAPETQGRREARYVAPRSESERTLAQIWSQILKVPQVGIQDDFFELGGHSLLATQVISRVREAFALELPLRWLFEARTIAAYAQCVEEAQRDQAGVLLPAFVAQPRGALLPLSYAQERLWFVEQMGLVGSAYNASIVRKVTGPLDAAVLERSLAELVRRHESLRTHFESVDGQLRQVVAPAGLFTLQRLDAETMQRHDGESLLEAFARQEAQRPFELSHGPLFRASLLAVGEQEHGLVLGMHHIISDGWSNEVLLRELGALYAAYGRGEASPLAEPELQYADYALWQRDWLQGEVLERQLAYWKAQLAGAPPALELPTDHARPAVPSYRGAIHRLAVPAELSAELGQLARQEGVTLFMLLLAAYQVVLSRWSGQDEVVVGTPVAGRTHRQTEGLVGFFVNTLALRGRVREAASFRELLAQVRESTLSAHAHQDLPFERLVQELTAARDLSRQPIFQVWFVLQRMAQEKHGIPGLQLDGIAREHVTAKFDLTLVLEETEAGLKGALEYASDLFERSTIERFAAHYLRVLEQVVARPEAPLDQLDLLDPRERRLLLSDWNATRVAYPQESCLHDAFEAQALKTPEAIAAVDGEGSLSYRELDQRADLLAQYLHQQGVGPDMVVALCMPRSTTMLVGMLGILKAGAAYLPIDPSTPAERMAFMLDDARVTILLTHGAVEEQLPSHASRAIFLDLDWPMIVRQVQRTPIGKPRPANAAYVIYTSGSTGRPKGVQVSHRSACASLSARRNHYGPEAPVMLLMPSVAFDSSVASIFWTLALGGSLVIPDDSEYRDVERLAEIARDRRVTHWLSTPSLYQALFDAGEYPRSLQTVVVAGEELTTTLGRLHFETAPSVRLYNEYGPTEAAVWSTVSFLTIKDFYGATDRKAAIGRPISNTQVYVLDEGQRMVPIGVAGELYIGGEGLARGYLKRPSLTAQRFIANPYGTAGSRLYRTGDLVRYRADGELEFLGRVDHQVKLRGYRIELGEIEVALGGYPGVKQAVVIDRVDGDGTKRLVAYLVGDGIEAEELRGWLGAQLPEYMLPSAYVTLEQIPLTANGKLDRHALPAPETQGRREARYVAPRSESERTLAQIWSQILKVPQVGIQDNFFELGGHSLVMVSVTKEIKRMLGVEAPIVALFKHPTVAELARYLDEGHEAGQLDRSELADRTAKQRRAGVVRKRDLKASPTASMSGDQHD